MATSTSSTHVTGGDTNDPRAWGTWNDSAVTKAIDNKRKHYKQYEHNSRLCFLPLVVSTYNDMCNDFLRLLWLLAEAQFEVAIASGLVDTDTALSHQVKLFAARLRSRIACVTAVSVPKRLTSLPPYDLHLAKPPYPRTPIDFDPDAPLFPS